MKQSEHVPLIAVLVVTAIVGGLNAWPSSSTSPDTDTFVGAVVSYQASPSPSASVTYYSTPSPTPSYYVPPSPSPSYSSSPSPVQAVTQPLLSIPKSGGDTIAPSAPRYLNIADVHYTPTRDILLVWSAPSTDNVGVTGYKIYRDGVAVKQIGSTFQYSPYATTTLPSFTGTYVYTLTAIDAAGNESAQSTSTIYKSYPVGTHVRLVNDIKNSSGAVVFPANSTGVTVSPYPFWFNSNIIHHAVKFDTASLNDESRLLSLCGSFYGECPGNMATVYVDYLGSWGGYMLIADPYMAVLQQADTVFPQVNVTSPLGGATLGGTATLVAAATDNVGVVGVTFLVDGVPIGAEDLTSPYSLSWNTASVTNGSHSITAQARDAAGNRTNSSVVPATISNLDPNKKPWENFSLSKWRLEARAKQTAPTDYYLSSISIRPTDQAAIAPWFFTNPVTSSAAGSMAFWLNATKNNDGTWYRTELREVMSGNNTTTNWSALVGTSTLAVDLKIPFAPTYNASSTQITIAQIHPVSGNPLLRVVWYAQPALNRYVKVHYKTDAVGNADASAFCPSTTTRVGDLMSIRISVINGKLTVLVNGLACLTNFAINPGWTQENYFKVGNYASQSYSGIGQVDVYKLEATHSEPGI